MVFFTYLKKSQVISGLIWIYLDLSGLIWTGLDWTGVCEKDYLQEIPSDKKPNINQTYLDWSL